jgi:hypothetical protein
MKFYLGDTALAKRKTLRPWRLPVDIKTMRITSLEELFHRMNLAIATFHHKKAAACY